MGKQSTQLILGSSSPARAAILNQMGVRYRALSPDIDESVLPDEPVSQYVRRLSREKALAVAGRLPPDESFIVIGSDQVAADEQGVIYSKPGSLANAAVMLRSMSGKLLRYYCGLTVLDTQSSHIYTDISVTEIQYRVFDEKLIQCYLSFDPSVANCASALRIESAGPMLVERYACSDPTSCQGLPSLLLDKMLRSHGYRISDFMPCHEFALS